MPTYIHQRPGWPDYEYDARALMPLLSDVLVHQGQLFGSLKVLGFEDLQDAKLEAISAEVVKSSEIEGERLDAETVRSSIARRLGISQGGVPSGDHYVEGVVEMALDASERPNVPLTAERLFNWHSALFPAGRSAFGELRVGQWRDDAKGRMQVVSKAMTSNEKAHFEAPVAELVQAEMKTFLEWFEGPGGASDILKAGIAHVWFVTIHPFDDGNGRIGRAILDMALARADKRPYRCYSVSAQIRKERKAYYDALECAQKGNLDYTEWLTWFLGCLGRAIEQASHTVEGAMTRTRFWQSHANVDLNDRQRAVLARMLMGLEGKMTNKKWKKLAGCSDATASRDLEGLVANGIFERLGEGRGVEYRLV